MVLELPSLSKTARLSILLVLTGSFFVVEIVVGECSSFYCHPNMCIVLTELSQAITQIRSLSSQIVSICSGVYFYLFKLARLQIYLLSVIHSDVISIVVALYAIRVSILACLGPIRFACLDASRRSDYVKSLQVTKRASKKTLHPRYSYGMHRAEIVAALANGVFLLALCLTIFLDALGRFYSKPGMLQALLPCCGLGD